MEAAGAFFLVGTAWRRLSEKMTEMWLEGGYTQGSTRLYRLWAQWETLIQLQSDREAIGQAVPEHKQNLLN